jgi:hypothetical protein
VLVDVSWKQGTGYKHLQMSTLSAIAQAKADYVADWKLNEK